MEKSEDEMKELGWKERVRMKRKSIRINKRTKDEKRVRE